MDWFNDLKTKFPVIAAEADGWDPSKVFGGSTKKRNWICNEGHKWNLIRDIDTATERKK